MLLLVSGATATLRTLPADAPVGHLLTPHNGNTLDSLLATGRPIACDNACFGGLDEPALVRMLMLWCERLLAQGAHPRRVLWCTVPDVVADHRATLRQFGRYAGLVGWAGLPLAFVAQDGCEPAAGVPWGDIRCLFIGGSTAWKEGEDAARLVRAAKDRGKWVHVGRVNTERRLRHFEALGADSIDGTQFSMFARTYLPRWSQRLRARQLGLLEEPTPWVA